MGNLKCADTEAYEDNVLKPEEVQKKIKNMKKKAKIYAKKKGTTPAKIHDVPEGESLFILAELKGSSRPILSFWDSGCSDSAFKVPGKELNGLCVNKGPIKFFAVGNNVLEAKQEWIVKVKLKNGDYQLVQGLTMDEVTCPMPMINLE